MLKEAVVLAPKAPAPTATLQAPVVFASKLFPPIATLVTPVVVKYPAQTPKKLLPLAVEFFKPA